MTFEEQLALGRLGEELVVRHMKRQGFGVIPSYEYAGADHDKAPRLMFESKGLVIPDVDACISGRRFWLEVKTYRAAEPNRARGGALVHGVKLRLYNDYLEVQRVTGTPVRIAVLEVATGDLLTAALSTLPVWGCEGNCCRHRPKPWHQVYWLRKDMTLRHTFSDSELAEIRQRWPAGKVAVEVRP